ncbi:hypothetical protein E4T50_14670 [Aureobasidium sp. EXF-12298]|nr:hypothetical protein E4T50_14670 [Aureobasidium sp. EXF-12298]KAI4752460.1 hypothetical protein E4T51_14384 [Aureobasidium sp. EXF-12344]KAI4769670.1 hypothetical protein E4T52_15301 [Aureobasidium sp. EXF-3400]
MFLDQAQMMEPCQSPPAPPHGYVLWQKQKLREHTDAVGKPLPPQYIDMGGWKYVRARDLAMCDRSPSSGFSLPERHKKEEPSDEPERLVEKAKIREYIFTGSREKDINALHDYIEACNKAIHALDPANRDARTLARLKLRMDMTILKESLKEELEVLTEENVGDGYYGFDDGPIDDCQFAQSQMRPRGYRWSCPGWL